MSDANIHFKIKEYIMRLSSKKEIIDELNKELESLIKAKEQLIQAKSILKNEYKINENKKKEIINYCNLNDESNIINNINKENKNNIKVNLKKRNYSAARPKRRLEINALNDLKKENNELEDELIYYNHELENVIQKVYDMELSCKLLMHQANSNNNEMKLPKNS